MAATHFKPHDGVVHVYGFELETSDGLVETLAKTLDSRESAQAERFATPVLRRKYVVSHAATRWTLSRYLHVPSQAIEFEFGEHGKPNLASGLGSALRFNLSHSGERCLVAVTTSASVGIDIERIRPMADWRAIAERFFSTEESLRLAEMPPELVESAFFVTWTRKESYIKALGLGLALDLGAFTVEVHPEHPARLLWAKDEAQGPKYWSMQDIDVGSEYRAAVTARWAEMTVELVEREATREWWRNFG